MSLSLDHDAILADCSVLSLDVFDTCIARAVFVPPDAFLLVAERHPDSVASVLREPIENVGTAMHLYPALRARAEETARQRSKSGEVGLARILSAVGDGSRVEQRVSDELDVERSLISPIVVVRDLALAATARGIRVIYVSDMYLSAQQIREFLDVAGFPSGDVWSSSDHGLSKHSGHLFRRVVAELDVAPSRIVHVGDNPVSDELRPRSAGIRTLFIPPARAAVSSRQEPFPATSEAGLDDSLALGISVLGARNLGPGDIDPTSASDIGRMALAPAQLAFASWLHREAPPGTLLFAARDMHDVRDVWRRIGGSEQEHRYFAASRRALAVPSLADGFHSQARDLLCGGRQPLTPNDMFRRVGVSRNRTLELARSIGLDPDCALSDGRERDAVWEMFRIAEDQLVEQARLELGYFEDYWMKLGLSDAPAVTLVDVGWRASVQWCLQRCLEILGRRTVVHGRYFALTEEREDLRGSAVGMLVDHSRPKRLRTHIEAGVPVIEKLFQADEGSTLRYCSDGPERSQHVHEPALVEIQTAARETIRRIIDYNAILGRAPIRPTPALANPILRILTQPRPSEARVLGSLTHSGDLAGVDSDQIVSTSKTSRFRLLAATFLASEWRPGLLASLGTPLWLRRLAVQGFSNLKLARRMANSLSRVLRGR